MLTHHTTSPPARSSCVSRSRVHSRRRMMFRCAGYTRSDTARAGGEVTHPLQWSSEVHAPDLALIYYKTPGGCKYCLVSCQKKAYELVEAMYKLYGNKSTFYNKSFDLAEYGLQVDIVTQRQLEKVMQEARNNIIKASRDVESKKKAMNKCNKEPL